MFARSQAAAGTRKGRLDDRQLSPGRSLKMWTNDLEPYQPGLLWVTALSPEAGKLDPWPS